MDKQLKKEYATLKEQIAYNETSVDLMKVKLNRLYWALRKTLEEGETILDISNVAYDAERKGKSKAEKDYNSE